MAAADDDAAATAFDLFVPGQSIHSQSQPSEGVFFGVAWNDRR